MTSSQAPPDEFAQRIAQAENFVPSEEQAAAAKVEAHAADRRGLTTLRYGVLCCLVLACFGTMAVKLPAAHGQMTLAQPRPKRVGVLLTDRGTDACVATLWRVARQLQDGRRLEAGTVCPVSKQPYQVRKIHKAMVIACPTPDRHHVHGIHITDTQLTPVVIP
jgi:hypothetical protein